MLAIEAYTRRVLGHVQPIVVANRAPLSLHAADVERNEPERLVRGAGGLVTAMSSLAVATDAVWVAAARNDGDRELASRAEKGSSARLTTDDGVTYRVAFAEPSQDAYDMYYTRISNPLLWFIHHYLWDLAREPVLDSATDHAWREGYQQVNRLFADRVAEEAAKSHKPPLVMVQDYHLYCAPAMIRERLPNVRLQHFIHVPWPNPEYWKILPKRMRDDVMHGVLGNDIIGLQTAHDVRNFLLTCEDNLGLSVDYRERTVFHEGRAVWVRSYPISIDVADFDEKAHSAEVLEEERAIEEWRPRYLVLRVDRTDLSKNIQRGFLAFERLLEQHHELHGDVQFWAYLQESRQDIDDYRSYLEGIVSLAARINRRFGRDGWMPIRMDIDDNLNKALAAYKSFDVLLVNPIYDGMNLVAKEGALCNTRDGVLVLSENAGCHEELGEFAITINPFDIDQTAEAIYLGLTMDRAERHERGERLREIVRTNDITKWITEQLRDIRELLG